MRLDEFLSRNTIVQIGQTLPGYVICEAIVDNPKDLISIVKKNGCYISEIRWWEHAKIAVGSIIGYGGPRDPREPSSYFFAETDIYKVFDVFTCDKDYYKYIEQVKKQYYNFDLFPAFDIRPITCTGKSCTGDGSVCSSIDD